MTTASLNYSSSVDCKPAGAFKLDAGKSPVVQGCLSYFPLALSEVAKVSEFGASKYAWKGWQYVDDGYNRYTNGLGRHLLAEENEDVDTESGLRHQAHVAWNALARLELLLKEKLKENNNNRTTPKPDQLYFHLGSDAECGLLDRSGVSATFGPAPEEPCQNSDRLRPGQIIRVSDPSVYVL